MVVTVLDDERPDLLGELRQLLGAQAAEVAWAVDLVEKHVVSLVPRVRIWCSADL